MEQTIPGSSRPRSGFRDAARFAAWDYASLQRLAADRLLRGGRPWAMAGMLMLALTAYLGGLLPDLNSVWQAGIRPIIHAFGAAMFANQFWQGIHAAMVLMMALYAAARAIAGLIDPVRRVTFDNVRIFWLYAIGQAAAGMVLTHLLPRVLATG